MPTHYEVLGVQPTSEQEVIDAAYKALIRKYHPDRVGDNDRIRDINIAYGVLSSPVKRKAYDVGLKLFPTKEVASRGSGSAQPPPGARKPSASAEDDNPQKRCPDCGEHVAGAAQLCRYCGFRFREKERKSGPSLAGCGFALALILLIAFFILIAEDTNTATLNDETGVSTEAPANDIGALLTANDPSVCGTDEVRELALSIIDESYPEFVKNGGPPVTFAAVSATEVKTDVHEITCSANMMAKWYGRTKATGISYKIRPAVDSQYVVEVLAPGLGATEALATHILVSQQEAAAKEKIANPTPPVDESSTPTAASTQEVDWLSADECNALGVSSDPRDFVNQPVENETVPTTKGADGLVYQTTVAGDCRRLDF